MTTLMETTKLNKLIGVIGKQGKRVENMIQIAAVECIAQSIVHRNADPAKRLYEAIPSGMRHDAMLSYFEKFGNLYWSKDTKRVEFFDRAKVIGPEAELSWNDDYVATVTAMHWTAAKAKPTPKSVFDVEDEVSKLLDRLNKLANDSTKEVHNKKLLEEITKTYNAYIFAEYAKSTTVDEKTTDAMDKEAELAEAAKGNNVVDLQAAA